MPCREVSTIIRWRMLDMNRTEAKLNLYLFFFAHTIISCSVSRPVLCVTDESPLFITKILLSQETESVPNAEL